ncbi:MAG: MXAN_6640 family putative metalloprotease [Solirubrobacterales bacterium]
MAACFPGVAIGAAPTADGASQTLAAVEALLDPGPSRSPDAARGSGAGTGPAAARSVTLLLRRLDRVLPQLERPERRRARSILARPDRSGDGDYFGREAAGSPVCDGGVCVHWSRSRRAAPPGADATGDGIPDFVEQVAAAAARSHEVQNQQLGWREPLPDGRQGARGKVGGSGQLDIYLSELGNSVFGYAAVDPGSRGRRRPGYLVLDNDYRGFKGDPLALMQVTLAHEYNHILQFAYDVAADAWLFESTATWMEEQVFPDVDDYIAFVRNFARAPAYPMAEPNGRRPVKIYGSAVWSHWLSSRYGPRVVRDAWDGVRGVEPSGSATAAFERALGTGVSFSAEFTEFAAATAEWSSDASFPDSALYPGVRRSKVSQGANELIRGRLDHTGYALVNVRPGAGSELELTGKIEKGVSGGMALVGRIGPRVGGEVVREVLHLPAGGRGKITLTDPARFDRVTAIGVNGDTSVDDRGRYTADGARVKLKLEMRR